MTGQKYFVSRFPADISKMKNVLDDILAYIQASYSELEDAAIFELKVVLSELLINAIKHGSGRDVDGFIKVVAGVTADGRALLVIEDQGEGYDTTLMNKYAILTADESRLEEIHETGRGLFIVKNLCEDFMVNEKGNKVVISIKLNGQKPV